MRTSREDSRGSPTVTRVSVRRSPLLVLAVALAALAVLSVHDSRPAFAQQAPITVNAGCTLAQAINEANGATQGVGGCAPGSDGAGAEGHDTIVLTGDITLTAHLPNIRSHITIEGNGFTIDGDNKYRPFETSVPISLTLNDMTLTNGRAKYGREGGAILMRGQLNPVAKPTVTLNAVTVSNSRSAQPGSDRPGGGIYCTVGVLNINDSVFSGNSSREGGGAISASRCDVTVTRSAFVNNRNEGFGGGALLASGWGSTTISNSTFYNNDGGGKGSALYLRTTHASGVHLTHVTITGNRNGEAVETGHNSTVLHLRNSIIYGNPSGDCNRSPGSVATNENNIVGVPGNCGAGTNGSSDDPLLASSATGDIPYFATLQDSPAINAAGNCASLTAEDQRGVARPQGSGCDIGAYEATPPCCAPANFSVTGMDRSLLLLWSESDASTTHYERQIKAADQASDGWDSLLLYVTDAPPTPFQQATGDPATKHVNLEILGLKPGTTYDVRVRAVNDVDDGPWATGQGTPTGDVGGL